MSGPVAPGPQQASHLFEYAVAVGAGTLFVVWGGAQLGAFLAHGHGLHAGLGDTIGFLVSLRRHWDDPAAAWPARVRAALPGAGLYWLATAVVVLAGTGLVALGWSVMHRDREPLDRRRRLGVPAQGRLARRGDLRPLLVRRPVPGRLVLGRVGRRLVATEDPTPRGRRMGMGRAAVALVGPTRSGKTTAAIGGILDWEGPAILCSVKSDLLAVTEARRSGLGRVSVFDPAGVTGRPSAGWSPLRGARDPAGAVRAAAALAEAAPRAGVEGGDFWLKMAEELLAALLVLAANVAGRSFLDVTRWILSTDMPHGDFVGEVAPLLRALRADTDPDRKSVASFAATVLEGLWRNDHRTVSSVYASARTLVWPWVDPVVAKATAGDPIDLDGLLRGSDTLYVCLPLADQNRLRPVLGGLLNDVVRLAYERYVSTNQPLDPPLLVVIDEAATLRPDQLPSWAATLAGIGVQLVTAWQSVSQIEAAYGRQTQAILTNHITKLFYAGMSDTEGLDYVSRLVGEEHLPARLSRSGGPAQGWPPEAVATLAVTPAAVLRQMDRGDALLIHGTLPPAHVRLRPWYRDRRLRRRALGESDARQHDLAQRATISRFGRPPSSDSKPISSFRSRALAIRSSVSKLVR